MDAACKHLREGLVRENALGSAFVVVQDGLEVVGGRDVLIQLSQAYLAAVTAQRAQAKRISLLALEKDPSSITEQQDQHVLTVIDAHRLMHGWDTEADEGSADDGTACTYSSLETLESLLLQRQHTQPDSSAGAAPDSTPPEHSIAIIIDSVSQLLLQHTHQKVLSFLSRLQSNPAVSCILTSIHRDLHEEHVVAGIDYLSTCSIQLQPLGRLHQEVAARHAGVNPHGCISFRYKRRAGRVNAESLLYTLMASGTIRMSAPPAALAAAITAESLVALSVQQQPWDRAQHPAAGLGVPPHLAAPAPAAAAAAPNNTAAAPGPGASFKAVAGGMKLDLNDQERQAKQQVRLPYEHHGQGKQYETGDFRDYLPVAAGGHTAARHMHDSAALLAPGHDGGPPPEVARLGHIMYVRDSEEEHDSDEDPDDDLDI